MQSTTYLTRPQRAIDQWPTFSPDGTRVAFSRFPLRWLGTHRLAYRLVPWQLWSVSMEDAPCATRLLVSPHSLTRPAWCRASDSIVVTIESIWRSRLARVDAAARIAPFSANSFGTHLFYPSWFPGGTKLVAAQFRYRRTSRARTLVEVNVQSGKLRTLTDPAEILVGKPAVSPDGRQIAFAGQRPDGGSYNETCNQIWLRMEDGGVQQLDRRPGRTPAWSPDGRWIAFQSQRETPSGYCIFVVPAGGGDPIRLSEPDLDAQHPTFSPDGTHLAFSARIHVDRPERGIAVLAVDLG